MDINATLWYRVFEYDHCRRFSLRFTAPFELLETYYLDEEAGACPSFLLEASLLDANARLYREERCSVMYRTVNRVGFQSVKT